MNNKKGFATTSIHAGHHKNAAGALSLPIYQLQHLYSIVPNKVVEDLLEKKKDTYIPD